MNIDRRTFFGALAAGLSVLAWGWARTAVAAISVPFRTLPQDVFIRGPRYKIEFNRIVLSRLRKS